MGKKISVKDIEILQSIAENPQIAEQARQDARKLLKEWKGQENLPTQTEPQESKESEKITWKLAYQRYQSAKSPAGKKKYEAILLDMVRAGEPIPNKVLGELDSEKVQESMQSFIALPAQTAQPAGTLSMMFEGIELTEEELRGCFEDYAEPERTINFTKANFKKEFATGTVTSKIGQEIVFNDRVFKKLESRYRMNLLGLIRPTLENPILVVKGRQGNHLYFKSFKKNSDGRLLLMLSVGQEMNDLVVSASNYDLPFYDVINNVNNGEIVFFLCAQGTSLTHPRSGSQAQSPVESSPIIDKGKDTNKNENTKEKEAKILALKLKTLQRILPTLPEGRERKLVQLQIKKIFALSFGGKA